MTAVWAIAGGALPIGASTSSPEQVLERVEKFGRRAKTVEFTAAIQSNGVAVGTLEQTAVFPNRGRSVLTRGADILDTNFVKDQAFARESSQGTPVEGLPYYPQYGRSSHYVAFERPQDITKVVALLKDPEIVSEGAGSTVVRGTFKQPGDIIRAGPNPYTSAHLDLTVAANGEPTSFTLVASGPDGEVTATANDIAWNSPVTVPKPKKTDLVNKDAVSQFGDAPLYQPKALPRGWKLDLARVLPAEQTAEGCAQVETVYVDPKSRQQNVIDIFQFPTTCAQALQGGEPFTLGSSQGTIREVSGQSLLAQFDVNGTTVQVGTSLTREEFNKVLGELEPLAFG